MMKNLNMNHVDMVKMLLYIYYLKIYLMDSYMTDIKCLMNLNMFYMKNDKIYMMYLINSMDFNHKNHSHIHIYQQNTLN